MMRGSSVQVNNIISQTDGQTDGEHDKIYLVVKIGKTSGSDKRHILNTGETNVAF